MHKFQALGTYPLLLLGKRNASGCFTTEIITNHSFSSPQEKLSIDTITNIFSSVLKGNSTATDFPFNSFNHTLVPYQYHTITGISYPYHKTNFNGNQCSQSSQILFLAVVIMEQWLLSEQPFRLSI